MQKKLSFTMAEILISLTIIGVIAAITLPSLRANINEKTWATQARAFHSRLSQALSMMPSLNGFGQYSGSFTGNAQNPSVTVTADNAAQAFATDGLSKVLQINNICAVPYNMSSENARKEFAKCGIPTKYKQWQANDTLNFPTKLSEKFIRWLGEASILNPNSTNYNPNPHRNIDTRAVAIETKNGESVAIFYNPNCVSGDVKFIGLETNQNKKNKRTFLPYMCAHFVVDFNGKKGPNKIGKDMWTMTALYPTDPDVITIQFDKLIYSTVVSEFQEAKDYCSSKDARLLNDREAMAVYFAEHINSMPLNEPSELSGYARYLDYSGAIVDFIKTAPWYTRACIKRH